MFSWIRSLISAAALVDLHSRRLRVRDISYGRNFEFEPLLSVDSEQRVVAIGRPIPSSAVKTYEPFASSTAFSEDRHIATLILQYAYSRLGAVGWIKPAPRILLRVDDDPSNGARLIDDEALAGLSKTAGARITIIHRGARLSDDEVTARLDGE